MADKLDIQQHHVLLFPFPAQGHVRSMLKLAELLNSTADDLYITFVNTEHIHRRFLTSSSPFIGRRPNFRFRTIPDGLPDDEDDSSRPFLQLEESLNSTRSREQLREVVVKEDDGWPRISCVVADAFVRLPTEVAEEMGIPLMLVLTSSACCTLAYCSLPQLIKTGEFPLQEGADMDELVQCVPGMETFLRRRDLPSHIRESKSVNDPQIQFRLRFYANLTRGRALILNTTESMDTLILPHIRSICPVTYTIGPFQTLLDNNHKSSSSTSSANLWQEDRSCISWLDSQPDDSVVYVSFGSITVVSRETLLEFWHGLVGSGHRFLWTIRPDMVRGESGIPAELEEATRERGFLVAWAPQEEVLSHRAVGCFLTHSGWNSTLESIVAGVPMICWPFFADQQINSRFVSEVWKVGLDMKDTCERGVVERMVREVMCGGEKGEELKRSARELVLAVRRSTEEGGSSYLNLQKLIEHIKSF